MKNYITFALCAFVLAFAFVFGHTQQVQASVDKIDWCHCEPNGNCQTLNLPVQALIQAGHMSANGNPLHAGDHAGQCVSATPTPTATPTPRPTATPTPTPTQHCEDSRHGHHDDDDNTDCVTPTVTPTATPIPTATPTPTQAPSNPGNPGGPGDGLSDGRSDGRSSCPECTMPPKTGDVLGATTDFAGTGAFENSLVNALGLLGGISTAVGTFLSKRNK